MNISRFFNQQILEKLNYQKVLTFLYLLFSFVTKANSRALGLFFQPRHCAFQCLNGLAYESPEDALSVISSVALS